ncbi:MAG: rhodanese-like domain-containing protein [Desulfocapsaceae bacterium]|jgi:rhodanese-related sulfurtransferase/rubrerythrin|nr:rhodanese-like domain-containing protein [Desulfocapsaceae bacterium]
MNWNTLFTREKKISPAETRRLLESSAFAKYQLLDVRQPKEYEEAHLPGAILIPLADLNHKLPTLDKNMPVIVYCRSGVRSKAACQILNQSGFSECFDMSGGILKWDGAEAVGGEQFGLEHFMSGDFSNAFSMAYQMEANLKQFYMVLSEDCQSSSEKKMLNEMALLEDGHMAKLRSKYKQQAVTSETAADIIEGGMTGAEIRSALAGTLNSAEDVLHLAMKLEAQAFDLYSRLSKEHQGSDSSAFFNEMSREEQAHLQRLSKQLDKLLEN